jgi:hypothetical protein
MHVVARGGRTWLGSPAPPERLVHLFRESDRRKPQTNVGLTAEIPGTWRGLVQAFSRDRPKPLLGRVRRQKLGIDPALQAGVLDLDPVSLPACSCEPRALGRRAKNGRVSGGCRPDVYAGTLQKDEIPVLRRGGSLGCHSTWSNLGRSLDGDGSGRNHTGRSARWLRHGRSRLHRGPGWRLRRYWRGFRGLRGYLRPWRGQEEVREPSNAQCRNDCSAGNQLLAGSKRFV